MTCSWPRWWPPGPKNWAFTDGHWVEPSDASRRCLHHLGGGRYFSSSGLIDTQADTHADS